MLYSYNSQEVKRMESAIVRRLWKIRKVLSGVYKSDDGFCLLGIETETGQNPHIKMGYDHCYTLRFSQMPLSTTKSKDRFQAIYKTPLKHITPAEAIPNGEDNIPHPVIMALRYAFSAGHTVFIDLDTHEAYVKIDNRLLKITTDKPKLPAKPSADELHEMHDELQEAGRESDPHH